MTVMYEEFFARFAQIARLYNVDKPRVLSYLFSPWISFKYIYEPSLNKYNLINTLKHKYFQLFETHKSDFMS